MTGTSIKSRKSVSRKKEYIVKFYSLKDDHYVCETKNDCLMTLKQAWEYSTTKINDGLYGVPEKVFE